MKKKYKKVSIVPNPSQNTYGSANTLIIGGVKSCLQFLRCFGHLANELEVQYSTLVWYLNDQLTEIMDDYMQNYCAESLKAISFFGRKSIGFKITKQFPKVTSVQIQLCNLGAQLPWLIKHPNFQTYVDWFFYQIGWIVSFVMSSFPCCNNWY